MRAFSALLCLLALVLVAAVACSTSPETARQDDAEDHLAEMVLALNAMGDARLAAAAAGIGSEREFFGDPAALANFSAAQDRFDDAADWLLDVPLERFAPEDRPGMREYKALLRTVQLEVAGYLTAGRSSNWGEVERRATQMSAAINELAEMSR